MGAYSTYTDQELTALLRGGEPKAMTEIYNRYWDKLLAVALNRLEHLEEAEECVQDVFLKLWKLREKLELKYTLGTYLAAAVRYRVYDMFAGQHRKLKTGKETLADLEEIVPDVIGADAELLEKELIEQIEQSVRQLPEKCRIIYKLSRDENFNNKEIAAALNISEKAVEAHLTRAFKGIRKNIAVTAPIAVFLMGM
ncbi:RNA polymerase sigma-70 factor (ECF subfamily) [Pedobacter sp. AK017]|uniref:RNA polymerase sigma factor n=1 Tax=Pedobacter sp. AK017 TaxID=2723073 RepID=UPI00161BB287|nr:RNA polymerase sigma-70 factor [Pedobacter sp. AK017]MBB5438499.1 RNA polymerase sigma-70 factor (ECF subfamily) [Pedobacter sp. AK017]